MPVPDPRSRPLRIALLSYRGKPHVGGQGIYIRHLSKALVDAGHHVEVLGGQPYPVLDPRVRLVKLPSLDIYNDHFPMRMPGLWEVKDWADAAELMSFSNGTFPEPLAFSLRAWSHLRKRVGEFDLVHDNQTLGYGLLGIQRSFPLIATIHHPITVDRRLELSHTDGRYRRLSLRRWYAFTRMQTRVARRIPRVMTVSSNSFKDIVHDHHVDPSRMHVVPVGVDPELFRPMDGVERRAGHLITTASADSAMKGLTFLLDAVAKLRTERDDVRLTIIGRKKDGGPTARKIDELGLEPHLTWVSGVPDERIVELYSESQVAVVPSLYEGFSLPAIEAMACGIPVVATTGGALPEVVGNNGETAVTVPPGNAEALTAALRRVLDDAELREAIGAAGRQRVADQWSWKRTAERTLDQYYALLDEQRTGSRATTC